MSKLTADDIPTARDTPWRHRGNGVITNARKRVLGAFESARDAEAVVSIINALADPGRQSLLKDSSND